MIRRSTLVLLVIFVALAAGAFFWQRSQEKKATTEATATPGSQLLFNFETQINGLHLERSSGGSLELGRDAQGAWKLISPEAEVTDIAAVESATGQLISATVLSTLEQSPSLEAAGLAKPVYRLQIDLADGNQVLVYIGNATPTSAGYYVMLTQKGMSGGMLVVSKYSLDPILKLLDNPPVAQTATPESGEQNPPSLILTPAP